MESYANQPVKTFGKSGPAIPQAKESISNSAAVPSAQKAMPPENNPQASDTNRDSKRDSASVAAQGQTSSSSSNGSRHKMRDTMRDDRPADSNANSTFLGAVGRLVTTAYQSQSAPSHPSKSQNQPRLSVNDPVVRSLIKLEFGELVRKCIQQMDRADEFEDALEKVIDQLKTAEAKNLSLEDQIAGQNTDIRKAQETVFATIASAGPKAEDDDVIRDRIQSVTKQWKPFAKMWALKHIDEIEDKHLDEAKEMFNKLCADTEFHAHDGLMMKKNRLKAPYVLLNAELAHFVTGSIIKFPFLAAFGLGTQCDDGSGDSFTTAEALGKVYDLILRDDQAGAHLWRSQTVAAIDPPAHSMLPNDTVRRQEADKRKEKLYRHLVSRFETSSARLLFRDCSEAGIIERRTQLLGIFRSSGQVFSPLWSQRVQVQAWGSETFLKKPFKIHSQEILPHTSHKLDSEEGDTSMDGMPIQLVVEPAIVARGNERGEDYARFKIWSRAVVWLSSGDTRPGSGRTNTG